MGGLENYVAKLQSIIDKAKKEDLFIARFKGNSLSNESAWLIYVPQRLMQEINLSKNKELSNFIFNNLLKQFPEYSQEEFQERIKENKFKLEEFNEPNYLEYFGVKKLQEFYEKGFVQIFEDSFDPH